MEVEFEWLLPGTQHSKYIPEMEYKLANFNWICNPFLLHNTFIYSMLFIHLFFFIKLCTGIDLFTGHGYRIKYKDVQAKNAAMESLLANYTS